MPSYSCLTNFTSTAKRWVPILGLGAVVYVVFWTMGYNPVGSPSLPYTTRGGATVAVAESSYANERDSRASRQSWGLWSDSSKTDGSADTPARSEQAETTSKQGRRSETKLAPVDSTKALGTTSSSELLRPITAVAVTSPRPPATRAAGTTTANNDVGHTWTPSDELFRGYSKVPFPLENVTNLPNAFKVVSDCRWDLDYLFFVHTAATHSEHRRVLRQVVGNSTYGAKYNWTAVFFVGMSPVDKVARSVASEAEANGDVIVLPYLDTYRNLTYKYVYGIKWTLEYCPRARYVLKLDDDIVVHLPSLMKKLAGGKPPGSPPSSSPTSTPPKLYCCVWNGMPVIRQTALPWYLSEKTYPKKVFPRYCSGSAVFMDSAALRPLYNATFAVPYIPIDDAYVTGELAAVAGVKHESLNRFYSFVSAKWPSVVNGSLMVVQVSNAEQRSQAWKSVAAALDKQRTAAVTSSSTLSPTVTRGTGASATVPSRATAKSSPSVVNVTSRTP
ncbi:UDP-GlcNAc:betaGal beta-1,3-N-acetylglucosaminyltransferase 7-like isoform X1 [Dermacentor andersoni]|uniref:UDP-GlcNAc:betaGal beta-1,3-N-acetylglucosaminyltransferase 7-like isoform X1 n=1 Tax=Dermacentor andersoni TaxID=34620 RepID=UPI0024172950|nr:beta-1,3-galactosyltransferase 4-like isoform X1 [Dermacentor andersoni]